MYLIKIIIICAVVLLICSLASKLLYKLGIPTLIIFLALGMLLGSDGIGGIYFDNYEFTKNISSIGLALILFHGGLGTSWKMAKPVAVQSILMSTVGVVITAGLTGLFCYFVFKTSILEGMLIGSIIASTDAASIFAILRSRNLNFKGGIASLLELESGSNDPITYMLMVLILSLMNPGSGVPLNELLALQLCFGFAIGLSTAGVALFILKRINFEITGLYSIFMIASFLLAYSLCEAVHGNGFLSVYILGIILGNNKIPHKRSLVQFFDGLSWLMQIMMFFTLGLLAFPSRIPQVMGIGVAISLFLILVARPVATVVILSWFKTPIKQQLLVSWVGLRGAVSMVFAVYALSSGALVKNDIFHIVFFVALFSVLVQGTLIPKVAKKLDLVDTQTTVFKTFNDYQEELNTELLEVEISEEHPWAKKKIMNADIPDDVLIVMIKRKGEVILPNGSTVIKIGDILVLTGNNIENLLI